MSRWARWGVERRQQDTELEAAYDRLDELLRSQFSKTPPEPESDTSEHEVARR